MRLKLASGHISEVIYILKHLRLNTRLTLIKTLVDMNIAANYMIPILSECNCVLDIVIHASKKQYRQIFDKLLSTYTFIDKPFYETVYKLYGNDPGSVNISQYLTGDKCCRILSTVYKVSPDIFDRICEQNSLINEHLLVSAKFLDERRVRKNISVASKETLNRALRIFSYSNLMEICLDLINNGAMILHYVIGIRLKTPLDPYGYKKISGEKYEIYLSSEGRVLLTQYPDQVVKNSSV